MAACARRRCRTSPRWYVYGDYCSGTVWALEVTGEELMIAAGNLVLGAVAAPSRRRRSVRVRSTCCPATGPVLRLAGA